MTTVIEASFCGYSSGDCECFCFAVPLDDYNRLSEQAGLSTDHPDKDRFHDGMFRFYPDYLLYDHLNKSQMYRFRIVIEAEPINGE